MENRPFFAQLERVTGQGAERAVADGQDVEGFRVDEGDVGSWVGGEGGEGEGQGEGESEVLVDGGTEEQKGGFTSPPRLCRKELV